MNDVDATDELFPEYPPGSFASVARFGRHHWRDTLDTGILTLHQGEICFWNGNGAVTFRCRRADVTGLHHSTARATVDFEVDAQRWTAAFVRHGGNTGQAYAPRPPLGVEQLGLPLYHLDDDIESMRELCDRWRAQLEG